MDGPGKITSANDFRTPPRILIPKLVCSRDKWKAKAADRKRLFRKERVRSRDLKASRQRWKERALAAEQGLEELRQRLRHADAALGEARSQLAALEDDSKKN